MNFYKKFGISFIVGIIILILSDLFDKNIPTQFEICTMLMITYLFVSQIIKDELN